MKNIGNEIKQLDDQLYKTRYIDRDYKQTEEIWKKVRASKTILEGATTIVRDKFDENNMFLGNSIVELMLIDYENIDEKLYQSLVDKIYSDIDLARLVLDGASNGGYSFLLMTMWNPKLQLTEDQKLFAIDEAMNKIGTVRYQEHLEQYREKLDTHPRTKDDQAVLMNIDGCKFDVGVKAANMYMYGLFSSLSDTQAHGCGAFDIRYWILRNPNFKNKMHSLVYDFYFDNEDYEDRLDEFKWDIVNSYTKGNQAVIMIDEVLEISPEEISRRLPRKQASKVINEINLINQLYEIRPPEWQKIKTL